MAVHFRESEGADGAETPPLEPSPESVTTSPTTSENRSESDAPPAYALAFEELDLKAVQTPPASYGATAVPTSGTGIQTQTAPLADLTQTVSAQVPALSPSPQQGDPNQPSAPSPSNFEQGIPAIPPSTPTAAPLSTPHPISGVTGFSGAASDAAAPTGASPSSQPPATPIPVATAPGAPQPAQPPLSPAQAGSPGQPSSLSSQAGQPTQAPIAGTPPAQNLGYEPHGLYASLGREENAGTVNRDLEPTISMRNVTKIYPAQPHKPALEDVSLDIYPGEFVFIVGHSGSGKSTFLRLLTRELRVTSGEILVAGQSLSKMRNWKVPFLRRQIGCVFQDFKLLQDRTTYENVAFSLECIGKPKSIIKAQVPEVLRLVGLADKMDMFPDQLSGGEQQRVSVARAMVNRPPLLICDEPTGNLDPAISLGIMKLLEAINKNGTTVIMATHDREMVDSMRKRVVALENGHLVRDQERGGYGFYGAL